MVAPSGARNCPPSLHLAANSLDGTSEKASPTSALSIQASTDAEGIACNLKAKTREFVDMRNPINAVANDRPWLNALGILNQETLNALEKAVSRETCNLVDGWAASCPATVREWEKDGTLLSRAKAAQDQAIEAQQFAAEDGVTHLSTWEMSEIYGGPNSSLPW